MKSNRTTMILFALCSFFGGLVFATPTMAATEKCVYYQHQTTGNKTATLCATLDNNNKVKSFTIKGSGNASNLKITANKTTAIFARNSGNPLSCPVSKGKIWSNTLTALEKCKPAKFIKKTVSAKKSNNNSGSSNNNNSGGSGSGNGSSGSSGNGNSGGSGNSGNGSSGNSGGSGNNTNNTSVSSCGENGVDTNLFGCVEDDGDGCGVYSILNLILTILTWGVGIAATAGLVISAIMYLTARDNESQVAKAKTRILEIVIGLALFAMMWAALQWLIPGGILNTGNIC